MDTLMTHPAVFGAAATLLLLIASFLGAGLRTRYTTLITENESSLNALQGAILGLLALLVGFTFSMGISRYDLHIQMEIDEANAIGTVVSRVDTLAPAEHDAALQILREYVPIRLRVATAVDVRELERIEADSAALQHKLWALATTAANERRDPISALFMTAVNDAIDANEKRTAALENRIPALAWQMLIFIGCVGSLFVGLSLPTRSKLLLATLPLVLGVVLTLILDLDSPHEGFIQVDQHSMQRVAATLK